MPAFVVRRILWLPVQLLLMVLVVFSILHLTAGDPARLIAGDGADQATVEAVRTSLGLDRPAPVQFALYLGRLLKGDLGRSIHTHQPVADELLQRFPVTLKLALTSLLLASAVGVALGVAAAARPYTLFDYTTMAGILVGVSMPAFWVGLLLIILFSVKLRLLPTGGAASAQHFVLPVLTLAASEIAVLARLALSELLEVLGQDYIRTARAKGLERRVVLLKHALKNGLIPIVTIMGVQLGHTLGGTVVIEQVFSLPGMGRYIIQSILSRDFPVVQGALLWVASVFVGLNFLVDTTYAWIDPRIRYG
jgi:ABC-type dipeptide/oligopeptide/nickel transport system permease component